jgi:hypothetical protein
MNEPAWLGEWLHSGHAIDFMLAVVALEVGVLALWRRATPRALGWRDLIGPVLAGILLLLALRSVLVGASPAVVMFWLTASFPAHLFDLRLRLARRD